MKQRELREQRFFMSFDGNSKWYIIPTEHRTRWDNLWVSDTGDDGLDFFKPYQIDEDVSRVTFTEWVIE